MTTTQTIRTEAHQAQLSKLQSEVETLREQLRRAQHLATVGTMTAMVAHEFNNILTPIMNYARMAQRNPAMVAKALDRAADGSMRAADICRALLDVSREQAEPREHCVAELVREALQAMARDPAKDGIELSIDVPEDLRLTTRGVELQQVLLNLLINARAALLESNRPRRIEISAGRNGNGVVFRVADNGAGIDPLNLPHIFDPFFSTKNSAGEAAQGYGLGLAFCREVLTSLGGEISVDSAPDCGATFTLHLPDYVTA